MATTTQAQTPTFMQRCEAVARLAEQLQRELDGLRPHVGDTVANPALINIANEVVKHRGAPRPAAPAPPAEIGAAMASDTNGAAKPKPATTAAVEDVTRKLPRVVRKVARAARDNYQGKEFAMADLGELLKVGSRTLIPTFNSLEKRGLFKKVGQGKRNGQEVNVYRLAKALVQKTA